MRARRFWSPALLLLTVAGLGAPALVRSQAPPDPKDEGPAPEQAPAKIPEEAKRLKNPVPPSPESIAQGKELFVTQCAMCHGSDGDGKGDLVERLNLRMPDFTDAEQQSRRTDGELFYLITHGHQDMPGEGDRLPDEWKWDLVNFIRSTGS